jgi:GMC oxidoreductase
VLVSEVISSCSLLLLVCRFPIIAKLVADRPTGGSVKIRSNNPTEDPLIDLGLLTHPFDIEAFKEGARLAKRFYSGPAWEGYITGYTGPDPDKDTHEEFLDKVRATAGSFYHPCGVTPISSKSSKAGVLDPEFKLKGATGLRIVDAGIMVREALSWSMPTMLIAIYSPTSRQLIRRLPSTLLLRLPQISLSEPGDPCITPGLILREM